MLWIPAFKSSVPALFSRPDCNKLQIWYISAHFYGNQALEAPLGGHFTDDT